MSDEIKAMCDWLGCGELDIPLLIDFGVTTEEKVREICETLIDSPWFKRDA